MKRILATLLLLICLVTAYAQELSVKSFYFASNDISGSSQLRLDGNGDACALVKVQLATQGAKFSGNTVGNVAYNSGEYWVYMTEGSKNLQVRHDNYLPLDVNFADYGISSLKGKMTYVLVLSIPSAVGATQTLTVKYSPKDAMLLVDGQMVEGGNGVAELQLPVGNHSYNVVKKGFIGQQGSITIAANVPGKLIVELDEEKVVEKTNTVQPTQQQQPVAVSSGNVKKKIQGVVIDGEDGEPLIAATVLIRGTGDRCFTDLDGKFTLVVHEGAELVFSYVGFETQTLKAYDNMKVVMQVDTKLKNKRRKR